MALDPGTKLGSYEVLEPLEGLGGEAYRATESDGGRTVTLRLLDPATTARVERDTAALAALGHPGIGAVYDIVGHDESRYLVSEYVEGETLAQRLARTRLDPAEALAIAIAVADALDQAHRRGVVHRGLNPASILLTRDGVKVIDFGWGMAKPGAGPAASLASTRTFTPQAMADAPGAMAYLAPEQLDGGDGDARSDVFALGTILYEMLTGKPAFEGKTQALLIAAITTVDPDPVSASQPMTPPALDFLVSRCVVKDPRKRLQTVRDLLSQLRWIAGEGSEGGLAASLEASKTRERRIRMALAAALVLVVALSPLVYLALRGSPDPVPARFIVSDFGFANAQVTSTPYLSPNGRWLTSSRGPDGLDALALDSVTKQILLYDHQVYQAFWNPSNDQELAFWEGGFLKRASVSGGETENIVEVPPPFGSGSWSPDGVIVYSSQGVLWRIRDTGGDPEQITTLDADTGETEHLAPVFLPDGRHFLFSVLSSQPGNNGIWVGSLDSPDRTRLFEADSRPWYSEPGYIFFNRADVVYAQAFDPGSLRISGDPTRIVDGVGMGGPSAAGEQSSSFANSATYSVSQTGILAYRLGRTGADGGEGAAGNAEIKSMIWFDRNGPATVVGEDGSYAGIDLAPDGVRFLVHRHDGNGGDIWLYDPDLGGMARRTFDASQENSSPVWSPDGDRFAFASRRDGRWGIYIKGADGTGPETRLLEDDAPLAPMSWAPNGEIVYWVQGGATFGDIWAVSATGEGDPRAVFETPADELFPQVSPDGNWIAYQKPDDAGVMQIWVDSFPEPQGNRGQITNDGAIWPRWRGDGEALELYFGAGAGINSVPLRVVGAAIQPSRPPELLFGVANPNLRGSSHYSVVASYLRFAVSGDGGRFLVPQPAAVAVTQEGSASTPGANLVRGLADDANGEPGASSGNDVAIVLDWTRLLPEE